MSAGTATGIHPTAIVAPDVELGDGVEIGPYAVIGPKVSIGSRCAIGPHAVLERNVRLGTGCRVGVGAVLGGDPQDLKYRGEETWVEIGDGSVIREYVTINRGTSHSWRTVVGKGCLIMSYVHVAHDCSIGDGAILSNSVGLAGHVVIGERATVGGMTGIHQFVRIGARAFVGGMGKVKKDVPPFVKADGSPARLYGLNTIGLQRTGMPAETLEELKKAYRLFFRSSLNVGQALEQARSVLASLPEVEEFISFIESSERGVLV